MDQEVPQEGLQPKPIVMTRKVSFRDENQSNQPIADVILVSKISTPQDGGFSCLKCELL